MNIRADVPFAHARLRGSAPNFCFVLRSERPIEVFFVTKARLEVQKPKKRWTPSGFYDCVGVYNNQGPVYMIRVGLGGQSGGKSSSKDTRNLIHSTKAQSSGRT